MFDSRLLLARVRRDARGDAKSGQCRRQGSRLDEMARGANGANSTFDALERRPLGEALADEVESRLPRRGRRPVAWVADVGWEEGSDGSVPYVDVAATDSEAAADVAKCLADIAGLTYADWLFRWRRSDESHWLIRTYPRLKIDDDLGEEQG